ncbi:LiaF transmembrane domain-containing protein [Chitinophaga sedimenti]|uniref:LiaF transmembrane domain-containing protein n=1 Tax=Chitinophaga sedimenti TaxID=2033606 RepID=UPI00355926B2
MNNYNRHQERKSSLWGGLILLVVGVFLLMKKLDLHIPHWIFSWETILIAIGLITGAKRNFTGAGWIILICIGGIFLIDDIFNWGVNMSRFIWPLVFICAGIFLVVQSTERRRREIILQPGENAEDYIANTSLFGGSKKWYSLKTSGEVTFQTPSGARKSTFRRPTLTV